MYCQIGHKSVIKVMHPERKTQMSQALVNAGVKIESFGAMTFLIFGSLLGGKILGIIAMFHLSCPSRPGSNYTNEIKHHSAAFEQKGDLSLFLRRPAHAALLRTVFKQKCGLALFLHPAPPSHLRVGFNAANSAGTKTQTDFDTAVQLRPPGCALGYPPPLGVRAAHVHMIGLMAALGLTVALFVSDVAFDNAKVRGDCKIGALLSILVVAMCWVVTRDQD